MSISALEAITSADLITLRLSILCRRQLNKVKRPSSVLLWRLRTITPISPRYAQLIFTLENCGAEIAGKNVEQN